MTTEIFRKWRERSRSVSLKCGQTARAKAEEYLHAWSRSACRARLRTVWVRDPSELAACFPQHRPLDALWRAKAGSGVIHDIAFACFLQQHFGAVYNEDVTLLAALSKECYLVIVERGTAVLCDLPSAVRADGDGRLHSDQGKPAMEFATGWKCWAIHGTGCSMEEALPCGDWDVVKLYDSHVRAHKLEMYARLGMPGPAWALSSIQLPWKDERTVIVHRPLGEARSCWYAVREEDAGRVPIQMLEPVPWREVAACA